MKLREAFDKHNSDKGRKHTYEIVYEKYFELLKNKPINLLEVGIFNGSSIAAWLDYFPNATVYGIDLFGIVPEENIPILKNERVRHIKADSTDSSLYQKIKDEWFDVEFDIIIDDGKHTHKANSDTFKTLINFLKDDGMYFIEDIFDFNVIEKRGIRSFSKKDVDWVHQHSNEISRETFDQFILDLNNYNVERFCMNRYMDSNIYKITK